MAVVVVAGASGFVGSRLVPGLRAEGHRVRCGSRDVRARARAQPGSAWVELDMERPETLAAALDGADAAVYLVHGMADHDDPGPSEAHAATAFIEAAEAAGVRRIVYLGAPTSDGADSPHLASRLNVGRILRSRSVSTIELQAAMIIGEGSESWTMVRDLALRLPLLVFPPWVGTRTQPVWIGDVVAALVTAVDLEHEGSAAYGIPGPEILTARQILERVAAVRGLKAAGISVPFLGAGMSSLSVRLITRADGRIARQLVAGLRSDILIDEPGFWALMPEHTRVGFDAAARRALRYEHKPTSALQRGWEAAVSALVGGRRGR